MSISREELERLHLIDVGGQLVERDVLHIAEKISEYDPNLYVQYLERPEKLDDPPFRVIEICKDGVRRVAFTAWTLDERLLERIHEADTARTNPSERLLDANARVREENQRRYQEKMLEAKDVTEHVIKSPKQSYTWKNPDTDEIVKFE